MSKRVSSSLSLKGSGSLGKISFNVQGTVQGVNFRYYTAKKAREINVTGFVQNDAAGTVSGEAQGSEDAIKKFIDIIKTGPPLAEVTGLKHSDIDTKDNEDRFVQYR